MSLHISPYAPAGVMVRGKGQSETENPQDRPSCQPAHSVSGPEPSAQAVAGVQVVANRPVEPHGSGVTDTIGRRKKKKKTWKEWTESCIQQKSEKTASTKTWLETDALSSQKFYKEMNTLFFFF